jgi:hypothetical protein
MKTLRKWWAVLATVVVTSCQIEPARASEWTPTHENTLVVAAVAATLLDWGQTRGLARQGWVDRGEQRHEKNPLLGPYPTVQKVDRHFVISLLVSGVVYCVLPPEYRRYYAASVLAVEAAAVGHNGLNVGVRVRF